jgi:hypothetical protein
MRWMGWSNHWSIWQWFRKPILSSWLIVARIPEGLTGMALRFSDVGTGWLIVRCRKEQRQGGAEVVGIASQVSAQQRGAKLGHRAEFISVIWIWISRGRSNNVNGKNKVNGKDNVKNPALAKGRLERGTLVRS